MYNNKLHDICSTSNLVHPRFKSETMSTIENPMFTMYSYALVIALLTYLKGAHCALLKARMGECTRLKVEHVSCNFLSLNRIFWPKYHSKRVITLFGCFLGNFSLRKNNWYDFLVKGGAQK